MDERFSILKDGFREVRDFFNVQVWDGDLLGPRLQTVPVFPLADHERDRPVAEGKVGSRDQPLSADDLDE